MQRCYYILFDGCSEQVPCTRARLVSDDVFIYDGGLQIYQWNGNGANKDERFKVKPRN